MEETNRKDIELSLKLFIVLSRAHRKINDSANKSIASFNLNPTEFAVLELLYHKGNQPLQHIGEKILIASGSITYVVDKLEKKGLVYRNPCSADRRVIYAEITDSGNKLMEEIFPVHEEFLHEQMSDLSNEEKNFLIHLLKKIGYHGSN
ncbi:MarR family winged helix-turn-helix transcriptional regulator [Gottfriedia acidiceleris]|jgi:MarR family 2-MHQ and catechol resistance regulon transcriptional repressor|uniref:MarR family winged helix-turn-helix transcriptional regulator n=1 Tax=Gottfriedia acidiceleris TaxID=371036 RepID=UPI00101C5F4C|nr:MarR family transcriptional regulator [Gottfriedia acidiceleris]